MEKQKSAGNAASATAGWGELFAGRNAIRSLTLVGGVALHAINVFIATTILPTVVNDIGGIDYYAWNTALFVTASILGSALIPRLLSQTDPRKAYLVAAIIFAAGTLGCGFASSMPVMLAGRAIQGLGGGMLLALSYAMIRIVFEDRLWPRAIALVSGMWGVATLIGPAVGGMFAELGVWRAAFWSLIPVIAIFAAIAMIILPAEANKKGSEDRLAWRQLILLTGSVLVISAASLSADSLVNLVGVIIALAMLILLVRVERRSEKRIMPKGTFRLNRLGALYLTMAFLSASVTSSEIFLPLFFQILHHQSPLIAGYLAAIMGAGWTCGSISSSGVAANSADRIIVGAPIVTALGMVVLAIFVPPGSSGQWSYILPLCLIMGVIGFSVGITWPHLLTRIFRRAEPEDQNLASASITTVQLFATALGAALAGMAANLAGLSDPGGVAGTASASLWLFVSFALMAVFALCFAIIMTRKA